MLWPEPLCFQRPKKVHQNVHTRPRPVPSLLKKSQKKEAKMFKSPVPAPMGTAPPGARVVLPAQAVRARGPCPGRAQVGTLPRLCARGDHDQAGRAPGPCPPDRERAGTLPPGPCARGDPAPQALCARGPCSPGCAPAGTLPPGPCPRGDLAPQAVCARGPCPPGRARVGTLPPGPWARGDPAPRPCARGDPAPQAVRAR